MESPLEIRGKGSEGNRGRGEFRHRLYVRSITYIQIAINITFPQITMPISLFHLLFSGFPLPPIQRKMDSRSQRKCEQLAAPKVSKKPSGGGHTGKPSLSYLLLYCRSLKGFQQP